MKRNGFWRLWLALMVAVSMTGARVAQQTAVAAAPEAPVQDDAAVEAWLATGWQAETQAAQVNAVVSFGFSFYSPQVVTITVGESVTWNGNFGPHPLFQVDAMTSDVAVAGGFSNTNSLVSSYVHTFTTAGTYYYHCRNHGSFGGGMRGTVVVLPAGGGTETPTPTPTATLEVIEPATATPTPTATATLEVIDPATATPTPTATDPATATASATRCITSCPMSLSAGCAG
jgi:plastocyanin